MRYAVDKFKNKIKNSDKNKVLWKKNKNDLNSDYKELLEE